MDFSDALKALKEGKKVIRKSFGVHSIEMIKNVDSLKGTSYSLALFYNSKMIADYEVSNADLFAKDWEIFEPKKVQVKTKTVEYITCPNCGEDIQVEHANKLVLCKYCKSEIQLERELTVEEVKCVLECDCIFDVVTLFNLMYLPMLSRGR